MNNVLKQAEEADEFIRICRVFDQHAWKTLQDRESNEWVGYFLLGLYYLPERQVTFYLPKSYWLQLEDIKTLDRAPALDADNAAQCRQRFDALRNLTQS
jgi:hypothetical protein